MWIAHTRSSVSKGWVWWITKAVNPGAESSDAYSHIADNNNIYYPNQTASIQPVSLRIVYVTEGIDIQDGDWVTLTYDGGDRKSVG